MKLITRDTAYAVSSLCYIFEHKERIVSVSELVRELGIPRPFLRKILQILDKKKILKSHKGQGGGFEPLKSPNKILLLDLIKIFQGPLRLNECLFKKAPCPYIKRCRLKKKMDKIQNYVISQLSNVTLTSLLKK